MESYNIFIVEDVLWYAEILRYHLSLNPDYKITRFETGKECLDNMFLKPDLVTVDLSLPDMRGDKLCEKMLVQYPQVPIIVVSSQENINVAVNLLKLSVTDYLVKDDCTKELLWNSISRIRENQSLKREVAFFKRGTYSQIIFSKYFYWTL